MGLVQRWDEARLLWEAKDWSIDEVATELQKQVAEGKWQQLADLELSESTVARRTRSNRAAPKGLGELVEELRTKPGHERETEIVEAGLRVLRGQPPRSKNEPREVAQALLAIFPTHDLALKLVDALLAQAQIASGNGSLLDVFAQAIAGRLPHVDTAKLARIVAKRIARTVPTLSFGRLAFVVVLASAVACGAWFLLDKTRSQSNSRPVSPVWFDPTAVLAIGEKAPKFPGWKNLDQPIPPGPLPGQKVPPCDPGLGQEEVNAGCWTGITAVKPPCGRAFRRGETCYLPVAADPKKPVGSNTVRAPAP